MPDPTQREMNDGESLMPQLSTFPKSYFEQQLTMVAIRAVSDWIHCFARLFTVRHSDECSIFRARNKEWVRENAMSVDADELSYLLTQCLSDCPAAPWMYARQPPRKTTHKGDPFNGETERNTDGVLRR